MTPNELREQFAKETGNLAERHPIQYFGWLESRLAEREKELEQAKRDRDNFHDGRRVWQEKYLAKDAECASLTRQLSLAKGELKEKEEELITANTDLELMTHDRNGVKSINEGIRAELATLRKQLSDSEEKLSESIRQTSLMVAEVERLKSIAERKQADVEQWNKLQDTLKKQGDRITVLTEENERSDKMRTTLGRDADGLRSQLSEAYEAIREHYRVISTQCYCQFCAQDLEYLPEHEEYVHPEPSDCIVLKSDN